MALLTSQTFIISTLLIFLMFGSLWAGKLSGDNVQIILVVLIPSVWGYKGAKKWKQNDSSTKE